MDNYLYHHGILGQKWGVRRFQNKDGSLTTAGRKHLNDLPSNDGSKKEENAEPKKKGLSSGQKKAIIAGAAVVGAGLAVYGGYKLSKYMKEYDSQIDKGFQASKDLLRRKYEHKSESVFKFSDGSTITKATNMLEGTKWNVGGGEAQKFMRSEKGTKMFLDDFAQTSKNRDEYLRNLDRLVKDTNGQLSTLNRVKGGLSIAKDRIKDRKKR